jgi:hypothetical protein
MASVRTSGATIRDQLPSDRPDWADLADTSQEDLEDSPPPPPRIDTQLSYLAASQDNLDNTQGDVLSQFASMGRSSGVGNNATVDAAAAASNGVTAHNSTATASTSASGWQPNLSAPSFVPNNILSSLPIVDEGAEASAITPSGRNSTAGAARPYIRRRITGKRRSSQDLLSGASPAARRVRTNDAMGLSDERDPSVPGDLPPASEEEWQRRATKRTAAVEQIKSSAEYKAFKMHHARTPSATPAPRTPDPTDRTISKRAWESGVMKWRTEIRATGDPIEPAD